MLRMPVELKVLIPIVLSLESEENLTNSRFLHLLKLNAPIDSSDDGNTINLIDKFPSATYLPMNRVVSRMIVVSALL